ncbi:MAG: class I SAM-dependent methyltransferase [Lachnospiraceae bacterium]|nr:class I SAM-dependent methyltransferase [Lachnospiraceae bacterium]
MEHRQEHVLDGLKSYWGVRSESYSRQNIEELNNWKKEAWRQLILQYAPPKKSMRILDVGTGPGFFAINLALAGHQVSAVDVTEEMLAYARENAEAYGAEAEFILYDGEHLPFADGSFDLVISRNVLWNLEKPKAALCEWQRVLVPGGRMVYFDANWYLYLFDEEQKARHDVAHANYHRLYPHAVHDKIGSQKAQFLEELARTLPLSRKHRPEWDETTLKAVGMDVIKVLPNAGDLVWDEEEKVHEQATPLFMICAQKNKEEFAQALELVKSAEQ